MNRHQYLGYWIEVFILPLSNDKLGYSAQVELPNQGGVMGSEICESYDMALRAAHELINSRHLLGGMIPPKNAAWN